VFDLNFNIHEKVRILIPQTFHDAVQKALISEEELNSRGQGKTPSRQNRWEILGEKQHHTLTRQNFGTVIHPKDMYSQKHKDIILRRGIPT
jgi:hypothetical protein